MRKKKALTISILMFALSCLCACSETVCFEVPTLIEPKTRQIEYVEAQYANVGPTELKTDKMSEIAVAIPTDYCQFFDKEVTIKDIKVSAGEYVSEGTVLAETKTEDTYDKIEDLKEEKEYLQGLYEIEDRQYQKDSFITETMSKRGISDYKKIMGTSEDHLRVSEKEALYGSAKEFEENRRLELMLRDFEQNFLDNEIKEAQKHLTNTSISANHDGVVTYVKDLGLGDVCNPSENVVVITDFDDVKVILNDVYNTDRLFEKYSSVYAVIDGKEYPVEKDAYSEEEYAIMQSRNLKFPERITVLNAPEIKVGDAFEVVFRNRYEENVLCVPNEAVYHDNEGDFVYVDRNGEDVQINVTVGVHDNYNTHIKSGLNRGDMVRAERGLLQQKKRETFFEVEQRKCIGFTLLNSKVKNYYAQNDGIVDEVFISPEEEVKKGQKALTLKTVTGRSDLNSISNSIEDLKNSTQVALADYDEQIEIQKRDRYYNAYVPWGVLYEDAKNARQADPQSDAAVELTRMEERYKTDEEVISARIDSLLLDKEILQYQNAYQEKLLRKQLARESKNRNAEGNYQIDFKENAKISNVNIKSGNAVHAGEILFTAKVDCAPQTVVYCSQSYQLGQKLLIGNGKNQYDAVIKGIMNEASSKYYFSKKNGKLYVTQNGNISNNYGYFIEVDEALYENPSDTISPYALCCCIKEK